MRVHECAIVKSAVKIFTSSRQHVEQCECALSIRHEKEFNTDAATAYSILLCYTEALANLLNILSLASIICPFTPSVQTCHSQLTNSFEE